MYAVFEMTIDRISSCTNLLLHSNCILRVQVKFVSRSLRRQYEQPTDGVTAPSRRLPVSTTRT